MLFFMQDSIRALFQVANCVVYFRFEHIDERKLVVAIDIHGQGVAVGLREVARAVGFIQLIPGLSVKGLRRTGQRTARGFSGNLRTVFQLVVNGVRQNHIGTPLRVQFQILADLHRRRIGFFYSVFFVEPADERIMAICGRIFGSESAVVNRFRFLGFLAFILCKRYRVLNRRPVRIKHNLRGRHLGSPVDRLFAAGVGIPAAKLICAFFQCGGVCGYIIIFMVYRFR